VYMALSMDGFITGPDDRMDHELGVGDESGSQDRSIPATRDRSIPALSLRPEEVPRSGWR
jgi:hypothetical protein